MKNKIGAITTESKLHDFDAMSTLQMQSVYLVWNWGG